MNKDEQPSGLMGQLIKQLTSYRQSIGFELLVFDRWVRFSR